MRCGSPARVARSADLRGSGGPVPARDGSCRGCDDLRMVEYGQGVGQATGLGGHAAGGGGTTDLGAGAAAFVTNAVNTVSALPPEQLLVLVIAIFFGLILLRRAF
jgi:hypothetical protein